jgi:hypothetical protein
VFELKPPAIEFAAPEPPYRCANCLTERIWTPGYCWRCEPFAKAVARDRALSALITGLGGLLMADDCSRSGIE